MTEPVDAHLRNRQGPRQTGKRKIRDHRDLRVWRKARRLADQCREAVSAFPSTQASLAGVICRLADEIPIEIATGQGQALHAAYLDHLDRAGSALRHLERRLIEGHKKGCIPSATGDPLLARAAEIDRMLKKLRVSLELAHASRKNTGQLR